MAKSTNPTTKDNQVKVDYSIDHVKLHDFGYEKSGNAKGDPEIYGSYLERILNGDLVDENHKSLTVEEKNEKRTQLKEVEQKLEEVNKLNAKVEQEIEEKNKKIEENRQELLQIRQGRAEDKEKLLNESFSPMKFSINLIILLMLTAYLFFFYVSAAYKALYVDLEKIATNIADGIGTGSVMPSPYELSEALQYNFLLFLIPFVFYAFGWAFHILLDLKKVYMYIFLTLLIGVTFAVDFLFALIIHNNTESAKELMGLATIPWSKSSTFYIILFMGFVVYIIWSILLDSLLREWAKRRITLNLSKIIAHLRKDVTILQKKLIPTQNLTASIQELKEDINTHVQGNIKGYIDQFTTGWISYLSPNGNLKDIKTKCLNIKKEFEEKHNIKPGIVKVIKRRA